MNEPLISQVDLVTLQQEIANAKGVNALEQRDCFYLATFVAIAERLENVADELSNVTTKLDAIHHELWASQS